MEQWAIGDAVVNVEARTTAFSWSRSKPRLLLGHVDVWSGRRDVLEHSERWRSVGVCSDPSKVVLRVVVMVPWGGRQGSKKFGMHSFIGTKLLWSAVDTFLPISPYVRGDKGDPAYFGSCSQTVISEARMQIVGINTLGMSTFLLLVHSVVVMVVMMR